MLLSLRSPTNGRKPVEYAFRSCGRLWPLLRLCDQLGLSDGVAGHGVFLVRHCMIPPREVTRERFVGH